MSFLWLVLVGQKVGRRFNNNCKLSLILKHSNSIYALGLNSDLTNSKTEIVRATRSQIWQHQWERPLEEAAAQVERILDSPLEQRTSKELKSFKV
ncbi:hypothetical protein CEXT_243961 [Caerostris extrusa]|uniref:Uncharacterized protein n=1 Tax=Caerostris extrusa TaxID=172846 RepID=A0AAV4RR89_CAEEX|nr:hypothetical protein CEXT_243961 [Caerostris extrusa]